MKQYQKANIFEVSVEFLCNSICHLSNITDTFKWSVSQMLLESAFR